MDAVFQTTGKQIRHELETNILPFWPSHVRDMENGGFYGKVAADCSVDNSVPRSAVLCARILWTYSQAAQRYANPEYRATADAAYDYLRRVFWDPQYGGVYWQVDCQGRPVMDRKHSYAQSFVIYGLTEYYRLTGDGESLRLAQTLFTLLDQHAHDPVYGGMVEARARDWSDMADMRLSSREPDCRKSMNTMLHVMEGYTNLLRVWRDDTLLHRQTEILTLFFDRIIDPQTAHFQLFFDDAWNSLEKMDSYGHDIEGSWLLVEAAEVVGDAVLIAKARQMACRMAEAVYREGLRADGAIFYEKKDGEEPERSQHWWVHAEGMVGFFNAWQIGGKTEYLDTALNLWKLIDTRFVDRQYGEWVKVLLADGTPDANVPKVGPWECPYHHARACYEMIDRLKV